jgi:hypothetical protein
VKEVEVGWVKCKMWHGWVTNIDIGKLTREEKGLCRKASCGEARRSTNANGEVRNTKAEEVRRSTEAEEVRRSTKAEALRRSEEEHRQGWVTGEK